jgi:hypothetical protein
LNKSTAKDENTKTSGLNIGNATKMSSTNIKCCNVLMIHCYEAMSSGYARHVWAMSMSMLLLIRKVSELGREG